MDIKPLSLFLQIQGLFIYTIMILSLNETFFKHLQRQGLLRFVSNDSFLASYDSIEIYS
jgi:hypothetical protein